MINDKIIRINDDKQRKWVETYFGETPNNPLYTINDWNPKSQQDKELKLVIKLAGELFQDPTDFESGIVFNPELIRSFFKEYLR